jgi:hypothetical protein
MDFHRRLEHSSRPGSAYFVTWRLDGSLPVTRVTDLWTSDGPKFVELDQLLDAVSTGPRWLERRDVAGVVVNALWKGVRESRYELGAWVLMPNQVHLALRSQWYTRLQPRFAYLLPRIASRSDAVADWLRVRYCP